MQTRDVPGKTSHSHETVVMGHQCSISFFVHSSSIGAWGSRSQIHGFAMLCNALQCFACAFDLLDPTKSKKETFECHPSSWVPALDLHFRRTWTEWTRSQKEIGNGWDLVYSTGCPRLGIDWIAQSQRFVNFGVQAESWRPNSFQNMLNCGLSTTQ